MNRVASLCNGDAETPVILDLLEFCARAEGEPIQVAYHSFFRHHHLSGDR
jgi:hypothetical protein